MNEGGPDYGEAPNDVYTALAAIATLFLLFGVIWLAVKSQQLFGSWLPLGGP